MLEPVLTRRHSMVARTLRTSAIIVSILAMVACTAGARAGDNARLVDHMDAFEEFLEDLRSAHSVDDRRTAYHRHFIARDPELYMTFIGDLGSFRDEFFMRVTDRILETDDQIRAHHDLARSQIPEAIAAAERAFGPQLSQVPIHLTLNLGQSNAQVRIHDDEITILYGLDTAAMTEDFIFPTTPRDFRPLTVHELFHAHHWQSNPFMAQMAPRFLPPRADAPLWVNLWSEGLATCAARVVFPEADIALVMGIEGIWEEAEARLAELAAALHPFLDSADVETTGKWLFVQPGREDGLPNKAGYIVGSVVAHLIVEEHGLEHATALRDAELRAAIDDAFTAVAAGEFEVSARQLCASA